MHATVAAGPLSTHAALLADVPLWGRILLLVGAAVVAAKLVDALTGRVLRRLVRGTETELDELLLDALHVPVLLTLLLGGVVAAEGSLPADLRASVGPYVGGPTLTALVVLWVWTLNRLGNRLLDRAKGGDSQYASFAPIFSNLLTFALLLGGLFGVLALWNVDVTPLLASAGIAGIAVGFAAKDTVANFFGGLALYFDRTYRVGDYVELEGGETGTVVEVGIRSTTLMTRDEVTVTVPNAVLNSAQVINQSAPKRRKRIRVPVGVAYGTDIDALEAVIADVAAGEALVLDSPTPRIRLLRFGDSALEYELRCWVRSPVRETKARHRLNRALYHRLAEADIEIPYPRRDVTVTTADGTAAEVASPSAEPTDADD